MLRLRLIHAVPPPSHETLPLGPHGPVDVGRTFLRIPKEDIEVLHRLHQDVALLLRADGNVVRVLPVDPLEAFVGPGAPTQLGFAALQFVV